MGRRTPLYDLHVELGARMVDFGGWDMPVNYGSQIEEHHAVRRDAGVFDVSHMCVIDARGARVREFLSKLVANDVAKLTTSGKALYSCMLNEAGGVIDDLIIYFLEESFFRIVVNAGTRDKDLAWMRKVAAPFGVELAERTDLAMIAVQGPNARAKVAELLPPEQRAAALALEVFVGRQLGDWFVARTGYTGEDGFEVMLPTADVARVWRELNALGVRSAGLGARDTLRLEAAMNLYGNDMDEGQNPLESGLSWTVSFENPARDFIGRKALEALKAAGLTRKLVALVLDDRGVLRGHQKVIVAGQADEQNVGEITSGTFSPTMEKSIAFARVPRATGATVQVDVRGKLLNARVVKAPFVRHGQSFGQLIFYGAIKMSSNIPADLKYTKSHEWVRTLADGNVEVGITDHAQGALGDLVFVEVPEVGKQLSAGDSFAVVESVKAASDVYAPVAGSVVEGNAALGSQPELINSEPYGAGWIMRIKPGSAPAGLLSANEYAAHLAAEG